MKLQKLYFCRYFLLAFTITACGDDDESSSASSTEVAMGSESLLAPSAENDLALAKASWMGLQTNRRKRNCNYTRDFHS